MTFIEAIEYAKRGMPVRRSQWADYWFSLWRGGWWWQSATEQRVVDTTDYADVDLLASDWTTMPRALRACPIDPGTGSTGGDVGPLPGGSGSPPMPIPPGAPPGFPGAPGGAGGSSGALGPTGSVTVPPPPPAGALEVELVGLIVEPHVGVANVKPNGRRSLQRMGAGSWEVFFESGTAGAQKIQLHITVTRAGAGSLADPYEYTVALNNSSDADHPAILSGGFAGNGGRRAPITNEVTMGLGEIHSGTAKVL